MYFRTLTLHRCESVLCYNVITTYRQLQDFVEHNIWRDVEVEHKILEREKVNDLDSELFSQTENNIDKIYVVMTDLIVVWAVG